MPSARKTSPEFRSFKLPWMFAFLLVISPFAYAQNPNSAGAQFVQAISAMCPKYVLGMVARPEIATVLRSKPVDVLAVCSCTEKSLTSDSRLQTYINVDEATFKVRIKSEQFKSYMITRLVASSLACLAPALEDSLAAAQLGL